MPYAVSTKATKENPKGKEKVATRSVRERKPRGAGYRKASADRQEAGPVDDAKRSTSAPRTNKFQVRRRNYQSHKPSGVQRVLYFRSQ